MRPGDKVRHPELGAGSIVEVHARGGQVGARVDFGYLTDWLPATELGIDTGSLRPSGEWTVEDDSPGQPTAAMTLSDAVVNARRGVLALKLGQVLEQHVLQLSTGTDTVQRKLEAIVSRAVQRRAQGVLIEGGWGSGKTHLLTMLRVIASSKGMATASVILDGDDVRLSEPMRLMAAVLESLRYPGEAVPGGIGGRLGQLRRSVIPWNLQFFGARRIAEVIGLLPVGAFDEPEILEILERYLMLSLPATQARAALAQHGYRGVALPSMAARNVAERSGRFREHLEGWTEVVTRTGAKGLALIVDEVDVEYAATTGWAAARAQERARRSSLLSALSECLQKRLPLVVAFGSASAGGEVAEEHDAVRNLARMLGDSVLTTIEAPRPDLAHMSQLVQRVADIYELGYPNRMANIDRRQFEMLKLAESHMTSEINPVPRKLVRKTLECLDVSPDLLNRGGRRPPRAPRR